MAAGASDSGSNRVAQKVALVTGAARGIGRAHAIRLAEEGADLILVDIAQASDSTPYELASTSDLAETARLVAALGRGVVARQVDVRDSAALKAVAEEGVAEFGRLDIVCVNAGIISYGRAVDISEESWRDLMDINVTGAWNTVRATVPLIRAGARGGSIVFTSSVTGLRPYEDMAHYVASKHAIVGLMGSLALELGPESIRVNALCPGGVGTGMIHNAETYAQYAPELPEEERTAEVLVASFQADNALPVPWVEPRDIANAMMFLVSDEGRFITGVSLPIDAGGILK